MADAGDVVMEVILRELGPRPTVEAIIERFATDHPSPAWEQMLALDYEEDERMAVAWFGGLLERRPPPDTINAFWFGLFNTTFESGRTGSVLYGAGSELFGMDPEWMCTLAWWPKGRYSQSRVQAELRPLGYAADETVGSLADYAVSLAHAAATVAAIVAALGPERVLGDAETRAIAVGHDSGDAILLGSLNPAGLDRSGCSWV